MAACVKELVFHLPAELLRTVHSLEQRKHPAGLSSSIALQLNPCLAMLMALQSELHPAAFLWVLKMGRHYFLKIILFHDPVDVGNLISGSSAFSKTSLNIRKFTVHFC